ncbi:MAG: hypothetical protein V9E92_05730 [Methylotenera sp.]
MNKSVIALMALMMLFIAGCASSGGSAAGAGDNGGLPEIAAYDDDGRRTVARYGSSRDVIGSAG